MFVGEVGFQVIQCEQVNESWASSGTAMSGEAERISEAPGMAEVANRPVPAVPAGAVWTGAGTVMAAIGRMRV